MRLLFGFAAFITRARARKQFSNLNRQQMLKALQYIKAQSSDSYQTEGTAG
jgi:hypothetical protein